MLNFPLRIFIVITNKTIEIYVRDKQEMNLKIKHFMMIKYIISLLVISCSLMQKPYWRIRMVNPLGHFLHLQNWFHLKLHTIGWIKNARKIFFHWEDCVSEIDLKWN